jgi:hypothetical protein
MADACYDEFRDGILGGGTHAQPDFSAGAFGAGLRDEGALALNLTTQIDVNDVAPTGWVTNGRTNAIPSVTVGVAGTGAVDHADTTTEFAAVTGASVESIDYFDYATAVDTTSPLLWNIDGWTGLPVTPNGGDIILAPAAGGVFQITAS